MDRPPFVALLSRSPTAEISALCVATFAIQGLVGLVLGTTGVLALFALSHPLTVAPWTFVTSVYAHASIGHLLGNLLVLLLVGLPLERLTSRRRFHLFFLCTGAAAAAFQLGMTSLLGVVPLLGVDGSPAVLGASGAIFALLGYFITGNRVTDGLFGRLSVPPWLQVGLLTAFALLVAFGTAGSPNVAIWGHFFGLFLGLLAGRVNLLRVRSSGRKAQG
jgi:membrane associated rhomboid family serine protease